MPPKTDIDAFIAACFKNLKERPQIDWAGVAKETGMSDRGAQNKFRDWMKKLDQDRGDDSDADTGKPSSKSKKGAIKKTKDKRKEDSKGEAGNGSNDEAEEEVANDEITQNTEEPPRKKPKVTPAAKKSTSTDKPTRKVVESKLVAKSGSEAEEAVTGPDDGELAQQGKDQKQPVLHDKMEASKKPRKAGKIQCAKTANSEEIEDMNAAKSRNAQEAKSTLSITIAEDKDGDAAIPTAALVAAVRNTIPPTSGEFNVGDHERDNSNEKTIEVKAPKRAAKTSKAKLQAEDPAAKKDFTADDTIVVARNN